jgi:hypothetical protein
VEELDILPLGDLLGSLGSDQRLSVTVDPRNGPKEYKQAVPQACSILKYVNRR